jgi:hybrid polyketide synthase / nonribosomal peptide synthetase ACE1
MTIDTACSSSLVAVHQGVQALRSGTSRVAIAAGTNLILSPEPYIAESTFHMLSPQGRSHMWDAGADGYGRGDGVAAVVLKRLTDAISDGDAIECVIRETGVNQDGRTSGITVPSADAQIALIEDTYRRAGLDLSSPSGQPQFFEAHGTGTKAGDPIEAEAIYRSIGKHFENASGSEKLYVGSIKSVIGHTEGTAGVAGLLKVSLALQHGFIPPNLLFNELNPAIKPFYKPLHVPTNAIPWPEVGIRRASVNSFGFGGTNAHAIVESYEPTASAAKEPAQVSSISPYTFSAASKAALKRVLKDAAAYLQATPGISAHDLAYTVNVRRSTLPFRAVHFSRTIDGLKSRINESITSKDWETVAVTRASTSPIRILGIFTGQGAQWAGMGKQLFEDSPFARARLWELETALATLPVSDRPIWSLRAELEAEASRSKLHLAQFSQPLCTALQIVLIDLLAAANVKFSAVVGHSSGEIAAAYAAGVLSARDAIVIAYYRGLYSGLAKSNTGQKGAMLAVGTSSEDAQEFISLPQFEGRISLAASNSPTSVTLSGDADAIEEALTVFEDEGKFARTLRVDKAYHSHHMQPCAIPYVKALRKASIEAKKPHKDTKWYSSVLDGTQLIGDARDELDGNYWARNMEQTVLFSTAVERAIAENSFTLGIEVGPHGALRGPVQDTIAAQGKSIPAYISAISRNTDNSESFSKCLGQIWASTPEGSIDLEKFQITAHGLTGSRQNFLKDFPTYPWDNQRIFWHESRRSRALRLRAEPGHPLLGTIVPDSNDTDLAWHQLLKVSDLPWLNGHRLQGQTVFPAAGYVALAIEAAVHLAKSASSTARIIELEELTIGRAITFANEKSGVETIFSLHVENTTNQKDDKIIIANFRSRSVIGDAVDAVLNASGRIKVVLQDDSTSEVEAILPAREDRQPTMVDVNKDDFYSELEKLGYQYSGRFRGLASLERKLGYGRGHLYKKTDSDDIHSSEKQLLIHPGLLDSAFQAIFLAYSWPGDGRLWSLHVPVSIKSIRIDVALSRANTDSYLNLDSAITMDGTVTGQPGIVGDVDIFTKEGRGLIQVEDIRIIPFASSSEAQDTRMFFTNDYGVAYPDGELTVVGDEASTEETEFGWLLERISHFYLRRLVNEITPEQEAKAEWHHKQLMNFARHIVQQVSDGTLAFGKKEWVHDTAKTLEPLLDAHRHIIDIPLMTSVGENLAGAVRGETVILQHMLKDGMLNRYYVESLGLKPYTAFLTKIIGQITHINPHLRILEIGAGTGGATKSIFRKIRNEFDQYTFTDISSGFFETAKGVFKEYADRMDFKVLDAEKDISTQSFQEQSYDLAIASLVIHATKDLEYTLRNIRRLLKPGGYLVMLEVTNNGPIRLSFTMGALEGWWLGAESGRTWTPCVPAAEWHSLLLKSGFSGVEFSTPEKDLLPRPFGVLVSRAVDERVKILIDPGFEPSPLSTISELAIIAGRSLSTIRLAQATARLLQSHCESPIQIVQGVEELTGLRLSTRLTVLYLGDLDLPVFKDLTEAAFAGLKALFAHAQNILWPTFGASRDNPYANMSVGFGRAMAMEQPHLHIQFIDFAAGAHPNAHLLADELLRLQILAGQDQDTKLLWSREPEILIDAEGRKWVPRVKPHLRFNESYNSSRRKIIFKADPAHEVVEVHDDEEEGKGRYVARVLVPENRLATGLEATKVRVLYSSSIKLRHSSKQAWYVNIGIDKATNTPVVVLSSSLASIVEVLKTVPIPFTHDLDKAPAHLRAITADLLASLISSEAETDAVTLLVEPDEYLAKIINKSATEKGLRIISVTSSPLKPSSAFVFIHPHSGNRAIQRALPSHVAHVIDFSNSATQGRTLAEQLKASLPGVARIDRVGVFQARDSSLVPLVSLLEDAVQSVRGGLPKTDVISVQDYITTRETHSSIIDWTITNTLSLVVKPTDALPLVRADRTYLLFGLAGAGGLGLSLAEYLVSQGARYILLTSRTPSVDEKLIARYRAQGVQIQIRPK